MKRKSVLKKQAAKKKKRHPLSRMWRGVTVTAGFFLRFAFFGIALILISLVFVLLYEYMLTSPYIRLEKIVVTGVDSAMKDDILEKAELGPDSSLLGIDLKKLKSTLEQNPWIQSIRLEKQFPHTLIIHAVRQEPWAIAAMGDLYYVNRAGKIFVEAKKGRKLDYPIITGLLEDGRIQEEQLRWAAHVLRILESEKRPWSFRDVSEVHVERDGKMFLYFTTLPVAIRVMGSEMEKRMGDLKRVVEHLNETGRIHTVKKIDLNYREGAVVSFKHG